MEGGIFANVLLLLLLLSGVEEPVELAELGTCGGAPPVVCAAVLAGDGPLASCAGAATIVGPAGKCIAGAQILRFCVLTNCGK